MSVLRSDPYSRVPGALRNRARGVTGGVTLFAFMFLSLALIVMSRLNHSWLHDMRGQLVETMLPTLKTVSVPAVRLQQVRRKVGAYMKVLSEIDRLEEQNEQLRRWEARARELEREIAKYRELLNARDTRAFAFVTGRVVADGRGPFARSVILNIGRNEKIRDGYPVVNGEGLVGRTLNAGATASRVLLLTDPNSRVPVVFGANSVRGVLVGNNTSAPTIQFVAQGVQAIVGDDVRTSGHGGLFPPGLSIGKVTRLKPSLQVALYANTDHIDFVSVLLFRRPDASDFEELKLSAQRRPVKTGEKVMALPTRPKSSLRRRASSRRSVSAEASEQ